MKLLRVLRNQVFSGPGLSSLFFMSLLATNLRADLIYVNISNTNTVLNGESWETAFTSLQAALDKAAVTSGSDEIWVATGVYVPSQIYSPNGVIGGASGLNTPFLMTFNLPDKVAIFGGFSGTEQQRNQRNPLAFPTTLSGTFSGGEVWHIVTLGNDINQTGVSAELDGLIIANGNASGPAGQNILFSPFLYDHSLGGGVYSTFGSNLVVVNLTFRNNSATATGGNTNGDGGALASVSSNLHIKDSRFDQNTSITEGGAVQIFNSFETVSHNAIIEKSSFTNNVTGLFGGALVGEGVLPNELSSVEIKHCAFVNNTADEGGAIVFDSIRALVNFSEFVGNIGRVSAGALATTNAVDTLTNAQLFGVDHEFIKFTTTICDSTFINNVALGDLAIHDTMFGGPVASGIDFPLGGGALVTYVNGFLVVINSSFINNRAVNGPGGAILNGNSSAQNFFGIAGLDAFVAQTTVKNSIFIDNEAEQTNNVSPNILGNGGALASLPGSFFTIPEITIADTALTVKDAVLKSNSAGGNGGAIYLQRTLAVLKNNRFSFNTATLLGNDIYAVDSIINGKPVAILVELINSLKAWVSKWSSYKDRENADITL